MPETVKVIIDTAPATAIYTPVDPEIIVSQTGPPGPKGDQGNPGEPGPPEIADLDGTYEIDSAVASYFILSLLSNSSVTLAEAEPGRSVAVQVEQTGSFSLEWPESVMWQNATPPVVTTTPGTTDLFVFVSGALGSWIGLVAGNNITL